MIRLIVIAMYYLQLEILLPSLCQILINAWFCCRLINVENTEGTIKNGQSSKTDNTGYTRRRKSKQKQNTICVKHHNVNG